MPTSGKPKISAIVAMSSNRVIGKNNQLPWHLPADLKHFKTLTTGHPIIMGRKTFASIGKALPNRTNIILTHDKNFKAKDCLIAHSLQEALHHGMKTNSEEIFIIGGAEIYLLFLAKITTIYLTLVHADVKGDAYLPNMLHEFTEVAREDFPRDDHHHYAYSFIQMERKLP